MIESLKSWKILDSRGNPTISAEITTEHGKAVAAAPSGASTGSHEVVPFGGSVEASLKMLQKISREIEGIDEKRQKKIDSLLKEIDGTNNFSRLGGNAAIAVSLAVLKAAALSENKEVAFHLNSDAKRFPLPLGNAVGGGAHGGGTDIQEFLLIPSGAESYWDALKANTEMHRLLKKIFSEEDPNFLSGKNDEGAWTSSLPAEQVLDFLVTAIEEIHPDAKIGLDVAAGEFFDGSDYIYEKQGMALSPGEQIDYISDLVDTYPIAFVEDPLDEDDFEGFSELMKKTNAIICGDDLTVTNPERVKKAIETEACNAIIVKPNQIGTMTDVFEVIEIAKKNDIRIALSHRSGETCDPIIAHLALANEALLLKTGIVGGERVAKHNELLRLWNNKSEMVKL